MLNNFWPINLTQTSYVRTRQRTTDGSKLGKEYVKAVCCHPAYLTYMQSASCKTPGWMTHKLESRLTGKISTISDMQIIPLCCKELDKIEHAYTHDSCFTMLS